jgi:universal stress protein E
MPDPRDGKKSRFNTPPWALLRASICPISIVRSADIKPRKKILEAIVIQKHDNPEYAILNEKILSHAKGIAEHYDADLHVINAYKDSMHYPDRNKIMEISGLPTDRVHVEEGEPSSVISDYATRIEADTVLIGTIPRTGKAAFMKGHTSEKVLNKIDLDVIAYS